MKLLYIKAFLRHLKNRPLAFNLAVQNYNQILSDGRSVARRIWILNQLEVV